MSGKGKSLFQKKPPSELSPVVRPEAGAQSVPQTVKGRNRRKELLAKQGNGADAMALTLGEKT